MISTPGFLTLTSEPVTLPFLSELHSICPYGALTFELLLALQALIHNKVPEYEDFLNIFQHHLSQHSFMFWMGTEWPILGLINNEFFMHLPYHDVDHRISCLPGSDDPNDATRGTQNDKIDWIAFKNLMRSKGDWFLASFHYVFDPRLNDVDRAMGDCPLGFALVHAIKSMICANTESICFRYHVSHVDRVLASIPIDVVAGSDWKLIDFLSHVKMKVTRHGYWLDFTRDELSNVVVSRVADKAFEDVVVSTSRSGEDFERVIKKINREVDFGMVTMTMVYGKKFTGKLPRFLRRAKVLGIEQLVVFCLDEEAWSICRKSGYADFCIRGTPSILNKFTLPQMFLNAGVDIFWIDFDIFLFKNPLELVRAKADGLPASGGEIQDRYDVLTASSFAADCVCSGLVYLRATEGVRQWWLQATAWMYRHTFEHDQKTVSAFLNAGERVASPADLPDVEIPIFGYLEAGQQFVSARHVEVGGWTGDADDIVIYHFLNGDSDDKASIKNDEDLDFYDDLIEAFYGENAPEVLFEEGHALPHRVSDELERLLMKSRWDERPIDRPICTGVVPVQRASKTD